MMVFTNYSSSGTYSDMLTGNFQQQTCCIDIPSVESQQEILSNLRGSRTEIYDFSLWKYGRNEMLRDRVFQVGHNVQCQGLSLILGSNIPSRIGISHVHQRNAYYLAPHYPGSNSDAMEGCNNSTYDTSSIARTIPSSKYLKVAQYLLDEVVSVKKAIKEHHSMKELTKDTREYNGDSQNKSSDPSIKSSSPHESKNNQSELSATEKQEVQNKLIKLLPILDK